MVTDIQETYTGKGGRYSFENHFTLDVGQFKSEAAFAVLKLVEVCMVNPDVGDQLAKELGNPDFRLVPAGTFLDEDDREQVALQGTFGHRFAKALGDLFVAHSTLRDQGSVSTQPELYGKMIGIIQCETPAERKEFIQRHCQEFRAAHPVSQ